jgi:hypothetical protein
MLFLTSFFLLGPHEQEPKQQKNTGALIAPLFIEKTQDRCQNRGAFADVPYISFGFLRPVVGLDLKAQTTAHRKFLLTENVT